MTATRQDIARRLFLAGEDLSEHAITSMRRAAKAGGFLSVVDVAKFATLDLAHQALERQVDEFPPAGSP